MSQTKIQLHVKTVWMEMLNASDITPEQNFFEAGGDSLLMIDMLFRLGSELGTEIDPGLLFEDPTLGGFSALVAASQENGKTIETGTN